MNRRMLHLLRILKSRIGPSEVGILLVLALIVGGVWAFLEIAAEVGEAEPVRVDQWLMDAIWQGSSPPVGPDWLEDMARDITSLGSYTVLMLLGGSVTVYFGLKHRFDLMALTVAAVAGGTLMSTGLKLLFARERPAIDHLVSVVSYSFPSGHATLSTVVYLTLGALLAHAEPEKRFKIYLLGVAALLAILVGLSRIYLGVHYPTDVLAGWIAGAVWALLCLMAAQWLRRRAPPDNANVRAGPSKGIEEGLPVMKASFTVSKLESLARFGYSSRGIIYLIIGSLAVQAAFHTGGRTTDSKGALVTILQQPFGQILLGIVAAGLLAYALWRFVQAGWDADRHGTGIKGLTIRTGLMISAVTHLALAFLAVSLIFGWSTGGNGSQGWTAWLLSLPGGRWVVGLIGTGVIGMGAAHMIKAWQGRFEHRLKIDGDTLDWVSPVCRFGLIARGVVFFIVGGFFITAALKFSSGEAKGFQGALEALERQPYGPWLLGTVAFGLVAFGVYSIVESLYRRIREPN